MEKRKVRKATRLKRRKTAKKRLTLDPLWTLGWIKAAGAGDIIWKKPLPYQVAQEGLLLLIKTKE